MSDIVRGRLFHKGTREGYSCFEYVSCWPRQTKLIVPSQNSMRRVCVEVRFILWGLAVEDPVDEQTLVVLHLFV